MAYILDALARRRLLGGAVLVLAGIAVAALVVLWPADGGDPPSTPKPKGTPSRLVSVPPLGLGFAHPDTWTRETDRRVIRLRSPEGSVILTVSSPLKGRRPERVKEALKAALTRRFAPARILRDGPGRLAGRRVRTFELAGRSGRRSVRALALVDSTPFRTYAVTLVTVARPSARRLTEARLILRTMRFTKPIRLEQ